VFPDPLAAREGQRAPAQSSLVAYLDIVTSVNGILLDADALEADVLSHEVLSNKDKPIILEVYNVKHGRYRTCQVTPSASWGGAGLMGVQVRYDVLDDADAAPDAALHVVGVEPGSPAALAGLVPEDDYVLGCVHSGFPSVQAFADYAASRQGDAVQLFVLRRSTDSVRLVTVAMSDADWGVPGGPRATGLGLELAAGHLHTMPNRSTYGVNEFAVPTGAAAAAAAAVLAGTAAGWAAASAGQEQAAALFSQHAPPLQSQAAPPPWPPSAGEGTGSAAPAQPSGAGKGALPQGHPLADPLGDHGHGHSHGHSGSEASSCGHSHGSAAGEGGVTPAAALAAIPTASASAVLPAATLNSPFAIYSQPQPLAAAGSTAPPFLGAGSGFPVAASRFQQHPQTGYRSLHPPVYPAPAPLSGAAPTAAH